jgi:hypothetical protein
MRIYALTITLRERLVDVPGEQLRDLVMLR